MFGGCCSYDDEDDDDEFERLSVDNGLNRTNLNDISVSDISQQNLVTKNPNFRPKEKREIAAVDSGFLAEKKQDEIFRSELSAEDYSPTQQEIFGSHKLVLDVADQQAIDAFDEEKADEYVRQIVDRHNFHRLAHGRPALKNSEELELKAQGLVDMMAEIDEIVRLTTYQSLTSNGLPIGQTIVQIDGMINAKNLVDTLLSEYFIAQRDPEKLVRKDFAPVLDASITHIGAAISLSSTKKSYTTILYVPNSKHLPLVDLDQ